MLGNLLYEMSKALGYDYDRVALKRDHYSPQGHAMIEQELNLIRKGLVNVLSNNKALNIYAALFPNHPAIKVDVVESQAMVIESPSVPAKQLPGNDSRNPSAGSNRPTGDGHS